MTFNLSCEMSWMDHHHHHYHHLTVNSLTVKQTISKEDPYISCQFYSLFLHGQSVKKEVPVRPFSFLDFRDEDKEKHHLLILY